MVLSSASVEKLIRKAGAYRVSEDAKAVLTEILEDYAMTISMEAVKLCEHAKRKTVKQEDIKLAHERTR
jgi:histone H3/H4